MQTAPTGGHSPSSSSDENCQWDSGASAHEESEAVPFSRMKEFDTARDLLVFAADKAGMQAAPRVAAAAPHSYVVHPLPAAFLLS